MIVYTHNMVVQFIINNYKLQMKGSDGSAASGGESDLSEWQRSARSEPALPGDASAGHRNRGRLRRRIQIICVSKYHNY